MRQFLILGIAACLVAGCETRDLRAEQQGECSSRNGVYHEGNDPDDDVCVISREEVIIFDDREAED